MAYKDPEKKRAGYKRWRLKHLQQARENANKWRRENPNKAREGVDRWRRDHPEAHSRNHKKHCATYHAKKRASAFEAEVCALSNIANVQEV